ncbi:hypothetical protein J1779_00615 [Rahnella sp. FC061912-K]|uniref:hypothetical protein n=1 Tax=Rahnella rivi TaxID=2816249 RepID=UPI001C27D3FD|nr:hypothetical protein [Rahnella rivi]MBU9828444.1 hypothetical protein [Rahnella rivi]
MNYLVVILPILISVLTYLQTLRKDNSGLVSELSKELALRTPNPYIIECLVSKIHSMRPISYKHIRKILASNNAYPSLLYIAKCRRLLCLAEPVINGNTVSFDFTHPFNKKVFRIMIMVLFICIIVFMYYEFIRMLNAAIDVYYQIQSLAVAFEWKKPELRFILVAYSSAVIATLIIYFLFARLFINIFQAKKMIIMANEVLHQSA